MNIGRVGVWAMTESMTADHAAALAQRVEQWGYGAMWIPEVTGRNALVFASWLLAKTSSLVVATGIAHIHGRDPQAMRSAQLTLNEQSGNRFLLGVGVSHAQVIEGVRGHSYGKPLDVGRRYADGMARAIYTAPMPSQPPATVLAALGPRMLELAADRFDGAHTYLVTPEHTAQARAILGPDKLLCVEQKVVLEEDAALARKIARGTVAHYLGPGNYRNNLLRIGFTADELDGEGSDRLIDALVAWGDRQAILDRIEAHLQAGADHVCIQAVNRDGNLVGAPDEDTLAALAPGNT